MSSQYVFFSCNSKLYEQTDDVSMGGSLGPVLANIIMTEFEQQTVKVLFDLWTSSVTQLN